jgi:hypothetical protein
VGAGTGIGTATGEVGDGTGIGTATGAAGAVAILSRLCRKKKNAKEETQERVRAVIKLSKN